MGSSSSRFAEIDSTTYQQHNKKILANLKPGDLVKFKRVLYYHWAIYIGEVKVIHLTGSSDQGSKELSVTTPCSVPHDKAEVKEDDFWSVAGNDKADFGNMEYHGWVPLEVTMIIKRAKESLGQTFYSLPSSNCEHFAKWCRYDKCESQQVDDAMRNLGLIVCAVATVGIAGVGINLLMKEDKKNEEGKRQR